MSYDLTTRLYSQRATADMAAAAQTAQDRQTRIANLHAWFCGETGQQLPLTMDLIFRWETWLAAGHSGPELRKVLLYLRREIEAQRRRPGCLKLRNLLQVETFEDDLALYQMDRAGKMSSETRIANPPDFVKAGGNGSK
jgi:hypothetical protein